jgi:hypothetical protein
MKVDIFFSSVFLILSMLLSDLKGRIYKQIMNINSSSNSQC